MLRVRRERGQISPLVSFIYDEADQFIAQESAESGMKESKNAAQGTGPAGKKVRAWNRHSDSADSIP